MVGFVIAVPTAATITNWHQNLALNRFGQLIAMSPHTRKVSVLLAVVAANVVLIMRLRWLKNSQGGINRL